MVIFIKDIKIWWVYEYSDALNIQFRLS